MGERLRGPLLLLLLLLGSGTLHQRRLPQTALSHCSTVLALFAVILIQLHCPYIISGHLCSRGRNFEQGQRRDKHGRKEEVRISPAVQKQCEWFLFKSFSKGRVVVQKAPSRMHTMRPMSGRMNQRVGALLCTARLTCAST